MDYGQCFQPESNSKRIPDTVVRLKDSFLEVRIL